MAKSGRRGQRETAELINTLVELGKRRLVEEPGFTPERATEVMREIAHDLARNYGGTLMYIPKDLAHELTRRDLQIYQRLDGTNANELALENNLSVQQVYAINRAVKEQLERERQGSLPGLDPQ